VDGVPIPECTLRAAVNETNSLVGAQTVDVPAGTYTLNNDLCCEGAGDAFNERGDLDITDDLTLNGAGADLTIVQQGTVAHSGFDRIAEIWGSETDAMLAGMTMRNARAPEGFNKDLGGSLRVTDGSLTVSEVVVDSSYATCTGGGIFNATPGSLTILSSTITNNDVGSSCETGGGVSNDGVSLVIEDSHFEGNSAGYGGALIAGSPTGTTTIEDSTFKDNSASSGGAIRQTGGEMIVSGSTFHGNNASSFGGGIDFFSGTSLLVTNSTFSANTTQNRGGAITANPAAFTLNHVTVADNTASNTVGGVAAHPGATVMNSILDSNSPTNCDVTFDAGHNLSSDTSCFADGGSDLRETNPELGDLGDNGGPTHTRALAETSPAIDAADLDTCLAADQRGAGRPEGDGCDIGAYEYDVDTDDDGVLNIDDDCPNTPSGAGVDANGCASSQLDDDEDGVMNDLDACPATPVADDVGADGCSYALSVTKKGKGTVRSDEVAPRINCGDVCVARYASDDSVTLTAKPKKGYKFSKWDPTGPCGAFVKQPCTLTLNGDKTAHAIFKKR
jgi:hypothetical protein